MVNLTVGQEYGGVVYAGDRVDNQHLYYPRQLNKKTALALTKGDIGYADPADDGKIRLATTGDKGPFVMVKENALAGDLKVLCWEDEGNWLIADVVGAAKPNAVLVPDTGKLKTVGADVTTGAYAIMVGLPSQEAELTSGNVLQGSLTTDGQAVIKVHNISRLAVAP